MISAELYATEETDGTLSLRCTNVYQSLSTVGAADTETIYVLTGCSVVLPNGGDWSLTYRRPADAYHTEETEDENGIRTFTVYPSRREAETRSAEDRAGGNIPDDDEDSQDTAPEGLVLTSASLGITVPLEIVQTETAEVLRPAGGKR